MLLSLRAWASTVIQVMAATVKQGGKTVLETEVPDYLAQPMRHLSVILPGRHTTTAWVSLEQ